MNLIEEYWKEEEGKSVISLPHKGFIAYQHVGNEFFITDMFVVKTSRGHGYGQKLGQMAEELAKELGCSAMTCNVHITGVNAGRATRKVRIFTEFGFRIDTTGMNVITMIKEI